MIVFRMKASYKMRKEPMVLALTLKLTGSIFMVCRYTLTFLSRKWAKRRSLLSIDEDETPELLTEIPDHSISRRSLLQMTPDDYNEAITSYENIFLPDAYQTADYLAVLAWAISWGDTYAPPDPMTLGCGAGNSQMRTAKADVLKMIDVLDQSAPPAFSPGMCECQSTH
jgi:hypothetical protein